MPQNDSCAKHQVEHCELDLASRWDEIDPVLQRVVDACAHRAYDETCCFAIRLALEEALSNALRHGNKNDPAKRIKLRFRIDCDSIELEIKDEGEGFDPQAVPDPTEDANLQIPAGRGIMLMRAYMSEVTFSDLGNSVRMRFVRRS